MKVILLQDVKKLGSAGDVKEVADGYGWNFLIPNGLAMEATQTKLKEMDEKKAKKAPKAMCAKSEGTSKLITNHLHFPSLYYKMRQKSTSFYK